MQKVRTKSQISNCLTNHFEYHIIFAEKEAQMISSFDDKFLEQNDELIKRLRASELSHPENLEKKAQQNAESKEFIRQIRIHDRNSAAKILNVRIGGRAHTR